MTLSAVNSALHRARQALARNYQREPSAQLDASDSRTQALLDRYLRAWEAADVDALVALLREDTIFAMPPTPSWFKGPEAIRLVLNVMPFAGDARGRWRLTATRANGQPAAALYQKDDARAGLYQGIGLQVLTVKGDSLSTITTFMNPAFLARFGLPPTLSV
jgi:RNA polymerase sigma-70 factor (ECF subfamily)